jgi:hypothetical protein
MSDLIDKGCPSDHPMLVNVIDEMARKGHRKETIMRITGADAATVDAHMLGAERHARGPLRAERTESEIREAAERMAKVRAARRPKTPVLPTE